jgi:integrase/recombinase XerD
MMFDTFIASQRSEHTRRAYRNDLANWQAFLGERAPTEETVIEWRDEIEAKLKPSSALRMFTTVRSYYKWAETDPNPFKRVKAPRKVSDWTPVVPDEAKVDAILSVCTSERDRAIIALLNNGLRAQEVCDLRVDDFEYERQYATWVLRVTGKGSKMRLVPANQESIIALHNYAMPRNGRLFPKLNPRKVYYVFEKWGKAAGVEGIHPHALRHGYATRLTRAQVGVTTLQRLLGHSRADTTAVYTHLDLGDLVDATKRDPRNQPQARTLKAVV